MFKCQISSKFNFIKVYTSLWCILNFTMHNDLKIQTVTSNNYYNKFNNSRILTRKLRLSISGIESHDFLCITRGTWEFRRFLFITHRSFN